MTNPIKELYTSLTDEELNRAVNEIRITEETGFFGKNS